MKDIYEESRSKGYDYVTTMQNIDINTWLQGDILAKGEGIKKKTKLLLRKAFEGIVPEHVVNRKKLGFPTPIRVWLKEELGRVVKDTIVTAKVSNYINKEYALKLLEDHIKNKSDNSRQIWTIFIFCIWHEIHIEGKNNLNYLGQEI